MANIGSVHIRPDGWSADVTIAGWAGEQGNIVYDFSSFSLLVTSEGYDSAGILGTVARTVKATKAVRLLFPNEAQLDEVDSAGDLVVRVALEEYVYDDDKNGGAGTSGVDPVATIGADWASITGDSTVAFSGGVTNNSTVDYPKVVAQWEWLKTPALDRVSSSFAIGVDAIHGFGIAAVKLSAVGSVSTFTTNATRLVPVTVQSTRTLLHRPAYQMDVNPAGYTESEDINLNYQAPRS